MTQFYGIRPAVTGNPMAPIQQQEGTGASNAQGLLRQPQQQGLPVQQGPNARSLAQKLDSMLFTAAQVSTRSVGKTKLQGTLANTKLSKAMRTKLGDEANLAFESFTKLSKLTGRQIAAALVVGEGGKFDWADNPAATALKEALDRQADLSELLHDVVNDPNVSGEAFETLSEMALQADRRQTEILALALQLADATGKAADDPDVEARLNAKLESLLPRQSLSMHGNEAALEKLKDNLQPLADRLDSFASRPNSSISAEELAALQQEVSMARNALSLAAREGFKTADGGRWMPDKAFFTVAMRIVEAAEQKLSNTRRGIGRCSLEKYVDKTFKLADDLPFVYKDNLKKLSRLAKNLAAAAKLRHEMYELAKSYVENPLKETKDKLLEKAVQYSRLSGAKIKWEINQLNEEINGQIDEQDFKALKAAFKQPGGMLSQVAHLVNCMKHVDEDLSPEKFLSTDSARALMEGKLTFSTIVEARIHGAEDADFNPKLDDTNLVSSQTLGSGGANTVYLVKYNDNTEYVFKPEAQGRQGMESLLLSQGYKPEQQVVQLNIATQKTAEVLGLEDVMPKSVAGCLKGQYGLFMEKAPGTTAGAFAKGKSEIGGLTAAQIKILPDEKYGKVVGEIIRQTNRLEWMDLITGQGDRHNKNYMIDVRPDATVTVKGIDNDQCFTAYRTGIRTFHLSGQHASRFLALQEDILHVYPEQYRNEIRRRLENDPGVVKNQDGSIDVDATKFKSGELHYLLRNSVGVHGSVLPEFIDEELYEKLQSLKAGEAREAYLADLRKRLPNKAVVSATMRLDQAIAHAEALKEKGMVVSKDDFSNRDVQKRILKNELSGKLPIEPTKDGNFCLKRGEVYNQVKRQTKSLFVRDLCDSLIRKDWFK